MILIIRLFNKDQVEVPINDSGYDDEETRELLEKIEASVNREVSKSLKHDIAVEIGKRIDTYGSNKKGRG